MNLIPLISLDILWKHSCALSEETSSDTFTYLKFSKYFRFLIVCIEFTVQEGDGKKVNIGE